MCKSRKQIIIGFIALLLLGSLANCGQKTMDDDYWVVFNDTVSNDYGYKDQKGNVVILPGKYLGCFTDTFRVFAIVATKAGFVAIDRKENILYQVFPYDNGPDYTSEGLFRILEDGKIGYADAATGKIVIKPQFICAFPFEDGVAKVSIDCRTQTEGEHTTWLSNNWFYIDKTGHQVNKLSTAK